LSAPIQNQKDFSTFKTLLAATCAIAFGSYFAFSLRLPVVPLFAVTLGASTSEVGLINSSFLLMAGVLALPLGLLGDRWGRRRLVSFGLVIASATSLLLYWSQTPMQLVGIYLGFGVGLAMIGPSLMAQVADISPPSHYGRAYGWYTSSIFTAMSLGPAVGGIMAHAFGFRPVFLAVAVALFLLLGPVLWLFPRDCTPTCKPSAGALSILVREGWHNHPLQGCWVVTLGSCIGLGVFFTFFPLYALKYQLNAGQIGIIFGAQAVVNALSRIPIGKITDQNNKIKLAFLGFLGLSLALAGFGLIHTFATFISLAMISGAVQALAFTPLGALIPEVVPAEARGLAMGGYNTASFLGMMLGAAGMGLVIQQIGFENGFFVVAGVNLIFTILFFIIFQTKHSYIQR
jgi:MFS family permease